MGSAKIKLELLFLEPTNPTELALRHFSNSMMYSEQYLPKSEYLKNSLAFLPKRRLVAFEAISSGVFIGCKDGYHMVCPGLSNSDCGLLQSCELLPSPRFGCMLNEIYMLLPSQD